MVRAGASSVRPERRPGFLTISGTFAMPSMAPSGRRSAAAPRTKADAVVGGHYHQRALVQALLPEPPDQPSHKPVGVSELEQVALLRLGREPRLFAPLVAGQPGDVRPVHRVGLPRRQVLPWVVRQRQVQEVQPRPVARTHARQEAIETRGPVLEPFGRHPAQAVRGGGLVAARPAKAGKGAIDRRQAVLEVLGQQQACRHHAEVVHQGADPIGCGTGRTGPAQPLWTEVRGRLLDVHVVALSQRREQAQRVVRGDREPSVGGAKAAEDGRHRLRRLVGHRGRVRIPGGIPGQASQMREPARVDPSATVAERCAGQLVEDHHHHRRRATHLAGSGRGLVRLGQDEVGDRRYEAGTAPRPRRAPAPAPTGRRAQAAFVRTPPHRRRRPRGRRARAGRRGRRPTPPAPGARSLRPARR